MICKEGSSDSSSAGAGAGAAGVDTGAGFLGAAGVLGTAGRRADSREASFGSGPAFCVFVAGFSSTVECLPVVQPGMLMNSSNVRTRGLQQSQPTSDQ